MFNFLDSLGFFNELAPCFVVLAALSGTVSDFAFRTLIFGCLSTKAFHLVLIKARRADIAGFNRNVAGAHAFEFTVQG